MSVDLKPVKLTARLNKDKAARILTQAPAYVDVDITPDPTGFRGSVVVHVEAPDIKRLLETLEGVE